MLLTRRGVLGIAASSVLLRHVGGCAYDLGVSDGDSFDDILDKIHRTDPLIAGGLSNHAPMALEALVALGHPERLVEWIRGYDGNLLVMSPGMGIPPLDRAAALGAIDRRAAWIATYQEEVFDLAPATLLGRDWPTLASGFAAVHGLLRTAHALRSLERSDTPSRRRELAAGLGYWSADHITLPGIPGARPQPGLGVLDALAACPLLPANLRHADGRILDGLAGVYEFSPFTDAVEAVDLDAMAPLDALDELTAAAARLRVTEGGSGSGLRRISYLHAFTGASALRLILPVLESANQRIAVAHAYQWIAAIHCAFSDAPGVPSSVQPTSATVAEITERAAQASDEHAIKLAEAGLREHALDPRPEYLRAAESELGA